MALLALYLLASSISVLKRSLLEIIDSIAIAAELIMPRSSNNGCGYKQIVPESIAIKWLSNQLWISLVFTVRCQLCKGRYSQVCVYLCLRHYCSYHSSSACGVSWWYNHVSVYIHANKYISIVPISYDLKKLSLNKTLLRSHHLEWHATCITEYNFLSCLRSCCVSSSFGRFFFSPLASALLCSLSFPSIVWNKIVVRKL